MVSSGSKIVLSGFIMEARSVRGGIPSTEVLKFISRDFYRLEASGISNKPGDEGLFLPVLTLAGKQLVICITEEKKLTKIVRLET